MGISKKTTFNYQVFIPTYPRLSLKPQPLIKLRRGPRLGGGKVAIHIYDTLSTSGKNHIITIWRNITRLISGKGGGKSSWFEEYTYVPVPWTKIAFESTYNKNQLDSLEKIVIKMP